mmetsp:Transcript_19066/g.29360  ORF Transcript_19066/g.29360 Transcript_19066/m.29360 type:complete len:82 (+) Transcript_19066:41-286(+)
MLRCWIVIDSSPRRRQSRAGKFRLESAFAHSMATNLKSVQLQLWTKTDFFPDRLIKPSSYGVQQLVGVSARSLVIANQFFV